MKKIKFREIEMDFKDHIIRSIFRNDWKISPYYDESMDEISLEHWVV